MDINEQQCDLVECVEDEDNECEAPQEPCDNYFFIPMDCTEQCKEVLDKKEFQKGIKDYSYVCGALTALCNIGLKPSEAIDYVVNRDTIKHNMDVTKIGANATIESAKHASIKSELENI